MRSPRNGRIRFRRRSGQRIWLRSVLRLAQTGARQVTISTCPLPRETGALGRGATPRCGADLLRSRTSVGSPWQQGCLYMHDTHSRQHMPALYAHHLLTVRWHGSRRVTRVGAAGRQHRRPPGSPQMCVRSIKIGRSLIPPKRISKWLTQGG